MKGRTGAVGTKAYATPGAGLKCEPERERVGSCACLPSPIDYGLIYRMDT